MSKLFDFQTNQKTIFRVVGAGDFNSFCEVEIIYYYLNNEILLFNDILIEGIKTLQTLLNKAIEYKLVTFDLDERKGMGFLWNEYCNRLNFENQDVDDFTSPFHLWSTDSTIGIDSWIYNIDERIYLEVSPTYRWHFDEPTGADCITYEEFIAEYAPINVLEINNRTAQEWIKICEDIFDNF